jgi:hypothetical protein
MYYQRLSTPHAELLRSEEFRGQFHGITLEDVCRSAASGEGPLAAIEDPTGGESADVEATIRGVAKNIFLLNAFLLNGTCSETPKGDDDETVDGR